MDVTEDVDSTNCFSVIDSYYQKNNPATQSIQSFNNFIEDGIPRILEGYGVVECENKYESSVTRIKFSTDDLKFTTPRTEAYYNTKTSTIQNKKIRFPNQEKVSSAKIKPRLLYPSEARLRKMSYEARIFTTIDVEKFVFINGDDEPKSIGSFTLHGVQIACIPVMIRSILCNLERNPDDEHDVEIHESALNRECSYDEGGYFVTNGAEKVLVGQEKLACNTVYVFPYKSASIGQVNNKSAKTSNSSDGTVKPSSDGSGEQALHYTKQMENVIPHVAEITSVQLDCGRPSVMKFSMYALPMKHAVDKKSCDTSVYSKYSDSLVIVCSFTNYSKKERIPLPILLRALGIDNEMQMCMLITKDPEVFTNIQEDIDNRCEKTRAIAKLIQPTLLLTKNMRNREKCLEYISKRIGNNAKTQTERVKTAYEFLHNRMLPHIQGQKSPLHRKGQFLCTMANKLCRCIMGLDQPSDRDSLENKRLDSAGSLMYGLFSKYISKLQGELQREIVYGKSGRQKSGHNGNNTALSVLNKGNGIRIDNVVTQIRSFFQKRAKAPSYMRYAISTGNWCISSRDAFSLGEAYKGVSQTMNTLNFHAKQSSLNRINAPISEQTKNTKARALHSTHWGMIDPCETPEGGPIGLVKNIALLTHISTHVTNKEMMFYLNGMKNFRCMDWIGNLGIEIFDHMDSEKDVTSVEYLSGAMESTTIELNGVNIGYTSNPGRFVVLYRFLRRYAKLLYPDNESLHLPLDSSIVFKVMENVIVIRSDSGRLCRPLFLVDPCDNRKLLIDKSTIEQLQDTISSESLDTESENGVYTSDNESNMYDSDEEIARRVKDKKISRRCDMEDIGFDDGSIVWTYKYMRKTFHNWVQCEREGKLHWPDLFFGGLVEFIDTSETQTSMIATYPSDLISQRDYCKTYTHCEIHPSMILGVASSLIPFPDHNQAPRNVYQSAMSKQAQGIYSTRDKYRVDTNSYKLWYPQKPFVTTRQANHLHYRELPQGQNVCVAIACYTGYNQEDSVIMNQSSLDRGLFRSTTTVTLSAVCKSVFSHNRMDASGIHCEQFEKPTREQVYGMKRANYEKLDTDGLPCVGTLYFKDDVVIGKVSVHEEQVQMTRRGKFHHRKTDASVIWRKDFPGYCEDVILTTNTNNEKMVHAKFRSVRVPQVGDKFSSRHGQKGTVGIVYRQEDMPFTCDGITPDIIMNPHAVPSRMTIGQLVEALGAKLASMSSLGSELDATAFSDINANQIADALHQIGYTKHGTERLYCGHTGKPMDAMIFFGPTYYQRLKHMVDDKIQARAKGPVDHLTRQPVQGKARGGGTRFGEMERDCILAHGGSAFLKDRLMDNSDPYRVHVCEMCGLLAIANLRTQKFECRRCMNTTEISQVQMPYASKLLIQELMSMGIAPRMVVEPSR